MSKDFEFPSPEIRPIDEQLLEAVYTQSLHRVLELLQQGADVNTKGHVISEEFGPKLVTPLILASEDGATDLVKVLLMECPSLDLHGVDNYGRAALHVAAESGHLDVVQELLSAEGIDIDFKDKCGFTALHLAALNCHAWIVRLLLEAKETVDSDEGAVEAAKNTAMVFLKESMGASQKPSIGKSERNARIPPKSAKKPSGVSQKRFKNGGKPKLAEKSFENGQKSTEAIPNHHPESVTDTVSSLLKFLKKSLISEQLKIVPLPLENARSSDKTVQESLKATELLKSSKEAFRSTCKSSKNVQQSFKTEHLEARRQSLDNHDEEVTEAQGVQNQVNGRHRFYSYRGEVDMIDMLLKGGMSSFQEEHSITTQRNIHPSVHSSMSDGTGMTLEYSTEILLNVEESAPAKEQLSELLIAAGRGDPVKELLKIPDIDVNAADGFGNTSLHLAAREGHLGVVKELLEAADIRANARNKCGKTPLILAVERCRIEVMRLLLGREDVDVNEKDGSQKCPLTIAAAKGYMGVVKCLIKRRKDIDVNAAGEGGHSTALHIAAARNYPGMVAELLRHEEIRLQNKGMPLERTPLHVAIGNRSLSVAKALLAHPAVDVNKKGAFDDCPLHAAVEGDSLEMVELLLLQKKLFVNRGGLHLGRSPLHLAAEKGNLDIVQALLKHPAIIVNIDDDEGNKPVDLAERNNHAACAQVLRKARRKKIKGQ